MGKQTSETKNDNDKRSECDAANNARQHLSQPAARPRCGRGVRRSAQPAVRGAERNQNAVARLDALAHWQSAKVRDALRRGGGMRSFRDWCAPTTPQSRKLTNRINFTRKNIAKSCSSRRHTPSTTTCAASGKTCRKRCTTKRCVCK